MGAKTITWMESGMKQDTHRLKYPIDYLFMSTSGKIHLLNGYIQWSPP